jgi:ABC-type proline/glycine betaine transport system ATPase subunit
VKDICDRVALMKGGKIVRIGLPSEILSSFSGTPSGQNVPYDGITEP